MNWVEWFGYFASVVVLISLTMSSLVKLRWINLAGASMFSIYGFLIHSIPIAFLNFGIVSINLYYLWSYYTMKESFTMIEANPNAPLFHHFLETNRADMERFVTVEELLQAQLVVYLLRNNEIAGVMAGNRHGDTLDLKLDYVIPKFRDFKIGEYFFIRHPEYFTKHGLHTIVAHAGDDEYRAYLKRMGFAEKEGGGEVWVKSLS